MQRLATQPRPHYQDILEEQGLLFHSLDNYWDESVCYRFSAGQIDEIEEATLQLHQMCLKAVEHVVNENRFGQLGIPSAFHQAIAASFKAQDTYLYGRFDLSYDGTNPPKMLEYNADTPTSLLEAAVCQWSWMEAKFPNADQFNSLNDKLVARWRKLLPKDTLLHLASMSSIEEDWVCLDYLANTAMAAGLQTTCLYLEDLRPDAHNKRLIDEEDIVIEHLFKLYPWEWVFEEPGANYFTQPGAPMSVYEPLWKSVLSCKGILPILWELFPNHPNLLPAYFEAGKMNHYVRKPLYSREGANVQIYGNRNLLHASEGAYGKEGFIEQALCLLPNFSNRYPLIGSWVVGDEPAGISIREDSSPITTNMSQFIPHFFD